MVSMGLDEDVSFLCLLFGGFTLLDTACTEVKQPVKIGFLPTNNWLDSLHNDFQTNSIF